MKDYFCKRIKKLLPLYCIVVISFSVVIFFFTRLSFQAYFVSKSFIKYLLSNLLTANFICPSLPGAFNGDAVNGSLWTIKVEIGFYILLPIILFLQKKFCKNENDIKKNNIFLLCLFIFCTFVMCLITFIVQKYNLSESLTNQLPSFLPYFVAGMIAFLNYDFIYKHQNKLIIPAILLFILRRFIFLEFILPIVLVIIIFWLAFHLKPLEIIGKETDYSYAMYLVHFPIIQMLKTTNVFEQTPVLGIVSVIGITFTIAYILEKCIQKKIR